MNSEKRVPFDFSHLTARHVFVVTTAFVRDTSGDRGPSPMGIRKTHY